MKKKLVLMAIMMIFALSLIGCQNGGHKDKGEKTVKGYIKAFYTVNKDDYEFYKKMIKGYKGSDNEAAKKFTEAYENNTSKFKKYLSNESYNIFYAERFSYGRVVSAYKKGYLIKVENLKVKKADEDKKSKTISYECDFQEVAINKDTDKIVSRTKEKQTFSVKQVNGEWKITNSPVY